MRHCPDDRIKGWKRLAHLLDNVKAARVVVALMLGALGSLPLVILTPPFQVPDEVQHFYRAYQLSEFHLLAEVQNGRSGGTLPASLPRLVKASVYTRDGIEYPVIAEPLAKTLQLRSIPLSPSQREFVAFPGSAFYSPLPYVPQVLGIAVGRVLGLGPLSMLYLGRLFNCLSALGLLGLAVSIMPFAEELVILAGLLPMSLYLYTSFSPDADLIGCALVFSALSISASGRGNWNTRELWMSAIAGAVFCSVKPVYAPMLLAAMLPGVDRKGELVKAMRSTAILLGAVLGVTAGWMIFAKSAMTSPLSGAHPLAQIGLIAHHPMILICVLLHMLGIVSLIDLYRQTIGEFGWLKVLLWPGVVYILPVISFVLLWKPGIRGPRERSAGRGFWLLTLVLVIGALIVAALYVGWTQVGQDRVVGVQGRYFIPLLVLAGMGAIEFFPERRSPAPRWQSLLSIAVVSLVEIAAMDATIIRAFHVL
jgi:Predicted membrane protein (DUF2142)